MTDGQAAGILYEEFYEWVSFRSVAGLGARPMFPLPDGTLVDPELAPMSELQRRRVELIGDFKFAPPPLLPKGARYI
jgi:hypothetical protein